MNKETLDIFGKMLSGKNQIILGKSRQTGTSWTSSSLAAWRHIHEKYERAQCRREKIKKIFNN
jgi:hypothetical protein